MAESLPPKQNAEHCDTHTPVAPALVPDWTLADWPSDWHLLRPVAGKGWLGTHPMEHHSTAAGQLLDLEEDRRSIILK